MRATSREGTAVGYVDVVLCLQLVCAACDSPSPEIRIPISDQSRNGFTTSFMVTQTAVYAVGLEFTQPIKDAEVDRLVDLAASKVGFPNPPSFDFTWRVLEGAATIGQGPGQFSAGPALTRVLSEAPVILIDIHHTLEDDGRIHDDGPRLERVC